MDADTKRRIDTARDILVGKVPDPKGQVEQITIALTYKFMDDMDQRAVKLGGKRTFFAGEFEGYSWSALMDSEIGAQQMLARYSRGIERMSENPGAAPLFRTIFANAFLPYNDSATLQQFLRIINSFEYDNSETLGDAYEYLTSIMGSQGDAGQFRTPRHIIEFIIDIVDPQLGERILDPACGTGGFLIAAHQHVVEANTDADGGSRLTPGQRGRLAGSLTGYDIDPGMVKIALLNMYLHGMVDPHIHEYDTLTSDERWNEFADVIVANPPFMTPKGGIRPHSKFGVRSRRSEVLFVDYMAEHLTTNGRAGIIVPEGIIFQSQNAHKSLRKMLVDGYLVAVVSLPSGVFNPYSGVKTSILVLDKALARATDTVGFFTAESDGYDLGAQRRPTDANDLPQVLDDVREYVRRVRAGESVEGWTPKTGHVVPRARIAADGEYHLGGERYRVRATRSAKWPMVRLGEVFERRNGHINPNSLEGPITYVGLENIESQTGALIGDTVLNDPSTVKSGKTQFNSNDILYGKLRPNLNKVWFSDLEGICSTDIFALVSKGSEVSGEFYAHLMRSKEFNDSVVARVSGSQLPRISWQSFASVPLPVPPINVQRELVEEVEGYQRVIDGARMVVENWRPRIEVDAAWPVVELGEVCEVNPKRSEVKTVDPHTTVSFLPMAEMREREMYTSPSGTRKLDEVRGTYTYFRDDDVLLARVTPCFENGKASIARRLENGIGFGSSEFHVMRCNGRVSPEWVYLCVSRDDFRRAAIDSMTGTGGLQRVPRDFVERWSIPVPSAAVQEGEIARVTRERDAIEANRELMVRMEARVREVVGRVWG